MPRFRLLALAALVHLGCQKPATNPSTPSTGEPAPVVVKVATPKKQAVHWSIEQPGTVQPFEVTPLVAKLSGYVRRVRVDIGDKVEGPKFDAQGNQTKPGQLLAEIDIPEMVEETAEKRAMVDQATAEVEQARRTLEVNEAQIAVAAAMIKEAEAGVPRAQADLERWKSELARIEDLVTRKVIDPQNRDETLRQFRSAEAAHREASAKVVSAQATLQQRQAQRERGLADIKTAEAKTKVTQAQVRRMEAMLLYREIRAPFDGIVTARNVYTDDFVQPDTGNHTRPLFTVARLDIVRVFIDVPEAAAEMAGTGAKATVRVPALNNRVFGEDAADEVKVTRTTGVIQPDSRTLRAELDIENRDGLLKPGMYAFVQIKAETAGATVLPAAAVLPADETYFCFVVEEGKAVKYRVRLGRTDAATLQVIERRKAAAVSGKWLPFEGTEQVVVGNLGALADGTAVQVWKE